MVAITSVILLKIITVGRYLFLASRKNKTVAGLQKSRPQLILTFEHFDSKSCNQLQSKERRGWSDWYLQKLTETSLPCLAFTDTDVLRTDYKEQERDKVLELHCSWSAVSSTSPAPSTRALLCRCHVVDARVGVRAPEVYCASGI